MDGIIVVDKPRGWTSHDAVGKMRRLANTRRVGHLGTLDPMLDRDTIERKLETFRGEFLLRPPAVSAKKIQGVPAYRLARQQIAVEMKPVPVEVFELKLLEIEGPEARIWAHCSAGTYMRSIAHELGQSMGWGAHLSALRRERSGDFPIDQART